MNLKQFVWIAFCSISAIFVLIFLMTGFRALLAIPIFLGLVVAFATFIVVATYFYLGR